MKIPELLLLICALPFIVACSAPSTAQDEPNPEKRAQQKQQGKKDTEYLQGGQEKQESALQNRQQIADLQTAMSSQARMGEYDNAIQIADKLLEVQGETVGLLVFRGELHYMAGEMEKSVADFDRAIEMDERIKPRLWQRGLALYYLDRFADGAEQFVVHRTVNGQDVENAVWHFACVAREKGVDAARESLIPIDRDPRVGMMPIHKLYAGEIEPEAVIAAATENSEADRDKKRNLFYAHFYIGLYYEAIGENEKSMEHMKMATADENYMPKQALMSQVGNVHVKLRDK